MPAIAKTWLPPQATETAPLGVIVPFAPAVAVIVNGPKAPKLASMVWLAWSSEKV